MKVSMESRERGAAAVEFALIALLLISMFFAIIEGSRLFYMQASLAAAARDGAREMAIHNDPTRAEAAVNNLFTPFGDVTGPTISYNPSPPDCEPGESITVIATAEAGLLTGLFGGGAVSMTGVGEMRCGG
ncbi:TadE/TadG family type IV pilus assembly protein [Ornithinimicrobium sediminis]|uniref:TadE/TadG family type IV pilus assembly protein n=1 Tax=Ornithinimicrobium sediminis TaxID=2904603 RepID=UPI001E2EB50B|nr:TadE family protein [Ornithinimicrobium sediminis]MCE0488190.1 pilus assembly protein [Ornithinimicrobium sediminis]